jgi:hypothetical protein
MQARKPTERQKFVFRLAEQGWSYNQIGLKYQKRFGTKQKLSREKVRMIIACMCPTQGQRAEFWKRRQENTIRVVDAYIRRRIHDRGKQAKG